MCVCVGGSWVGSRKSFGGKKQTGFQREVGKLLMGRKKDGGERQGAVEERQGPRERIGGREIRWGFSFGQGSGCFASQLCLF